MLPLTEHGEARERDSAAGENPVCLKRSHWIRDSSLFWTDFADGAWEVAKSNNSGGCGCNRHQLSCCSGAVCNNAALPFHSLPVVFCLYSWTLWGFSFIRRPANQTLLVLIRLQDLLAFIIDLCVLSGASRLCHRCLSLLLVYLWFYLNYFNVWMFDDWQKDKKKEEINLQRTSQFLFL